MFLEVRLRHLFERCFASLHALLDLVVVDKKDFVRSDETITSCKSTIINSFPMSSNISPLSGKKIIVSGAGIAGLAFVISLRRLWNDNLGIFPSIVIYEREHGQPEPSREGYAISIRSDDISLGVQALQQMGILEQVLDVSITRKGEERGYFGLWSLDWRRLVRVRDETPAGLPKSGMRIARTKMRQILLKNATEWERVVWGVSCTTVTHTSDSGVCVGLSNGAEDECDFLVVADGANSKIRACIRPDDKLNFAGPVCISAVARFSGPPPEPVDRDWGIIPSGKGVALFASPMDNQSANWSISYIASKPRTPRRQPISQEMCTQLIAEAKERGCTFKEPFHALVENSDPATLMVFNAMDKEPFAHGKINAIPERIVFIGDSNHAVSPFAGNGANLALKDGFDLAKCYCTYDTIASAVEAYDKKSMPRASASLRLSHASIAVVHSSGLGWRLSYLALLTFGGFLTLFYRCKDFIGRKYKLVID
jgi:2-polyprenyl-6-methoxyphenol hydroxylase-like FAD-dependent oxidoreductase